MRSAGVDVSQADDVAAMLAPARRRSTAQSDAKNLRATIEDRRRDLRFREKKLARPGWRRRRGARLARALARPVGSASANPTTTAVVRETLEALSELASTLEKRAELTDRIAKMQRDQISSGPKSMRSPLRSGYHESGHPRLCQAVMDCIATPRRRPTDGVRWNRGSHRAGQGARARGRNRGNAGPFEPDDGPLRSRS